MLLQSLLLRRPAVPVEVVPPSGDLYDALPIGRTFSGVDLFVGIDPSLSIAEQPRSYVDTTMPTIDASWETFTPPLGGDIQGTLDAAMAHNGPSVVILEDDTLYLHDNIVEVRNKGSDHWTLLMSRSAYNRHRWDTGSFPAACKRLTASQRALCARLANSGPTAFGPAIRCLDQTARKFRMVGICIDGGEYAAAGTSTPLYLARLGAINEGGHQATDPTKVPQDIIVDRCLFMQSGTRHVRRALELNGIRMAVIDSTVSDIWNQVQECQAIGIFGGPGPYKIVNNRLEAPSQGVLLGGSTALAASMVPADIEIRLNHFHEPEHWAADSISRSGHKTMMETKTGHRVLVLQNLFTNHRGSFGQPITIKNENQNSSNGETWEYSDQITVLANLIDGCRGFATVVARYALGNQLPLAECELSLNLVKRMGPTFGYESATMMALSDGLQDGGRDILNGNQIPSNCRIRVRKNTAVNDTRITGSGIRFGGSEGGIFVYAEITDNIFSGSWHTGVGGSGRPQPTAGDGVVNYHAPNRLLDGNLVARSPLTGGGYPTGYSGIYAEGTRFASSLAAIGFVDYANGNMRLSPGSAFATIATDGGAPGTDVDYVELATAGCSTGDWGL